jgi:hypothetical protein
MHLRYEEWLQHVFDHPVSDPAWYWGDDAPSFEADEGEIAELIEITFLNPGRDLMRYSDAQVNQGIWYVASMSCSDYIWSLNNPGVPLEGRLSAIASIATLYRDCFALRCTRTLSHLDEQPCSPLNGSCYMFWDISALTNIQDEPNAAAVAGACFSVLSEMLVIDHAACQEAAIHGYLEFQYSHPEQVAAAMDSFLQEMPIADPRLKTYAMQARNGYGL